MRRKVGFSALGKLQLRHLSGTIRKWLPRGREPACEAKTLSRARCRVRCAARNDRQKTPESRVQLLDGEVVQLGWYRFNLVA